MKNKRFKKALSVFLSILMLMSCWVWVAPTDASAANKYYVKVYVNIYDGSDGYGGTYSVEESTGKPKNYSWATNDGWYGRVNMTGFTVFGEKGDYDAQDVSAALLEAEKLNTYYDMSGLSNDNANGDWDSKAIAKAEYTFVLDSFPVEIFWMNDENNWDGGNTGFAIRKLTVATSENGTEHTMWEGLAGSDSETYNYYGSITPTGIHTCFEDYAKNYDMNDYKFYKAITTSSQRQWTDPYTYGSAGTYYLNEYANGGVSATFSEGTSSVASTVDYIDTSSSDTYYVNFTNHSKTQAATITGIYNNGNFITSPADSTASDPLEPGETRSFEINKSKYGSLAKYNGAANFTFEYTLSNVYASDDINASLARFLQPAYIGLWNESSYSKSGTTFSLNNIGNLQVTFQTTEGILETVSTPSGKVDHASVEYRYYIDNSVVDNSWEKTGLRFYITETNNSRVHFQNKNKTAGTMRFSGPITNTTTASLKMADFAFGSITENFVYNVSATANYNQTVTPTWEPKTSDSYATLYNDNPAWVRFGGTTFEIDPDSETQYANILLSDMLFNDYYNYQAKFSASIDVYAVNKAELRNYIQSTLLDFAPMSLRYNTTAFETYQNKLAAAMNVLADQKTNQKAVNNALAELKSAVADLQKTDNLINQVAELTHIQYVDDIGSEVAAKIAERYVLIPLGGHTVPQNTAYIGNGTYKDKTNKKTSITTNYSKEDTSIDILNHYYWNIDYSQINPTIDLLEAAVENFDSKTHSEAFKIALENAKKELESIKQTEGDDSPTAQEDIDNYINAATNLLAHIGTSNDYCDYDANNDGVDELKTKIPTCLEEGYTYYQCNICGKIQEVETLDITDHSYVEDANGNYVVFFDETTHWYECGVCGYKYMHENHTTSATPDSNDANSHIVECTYVDNTSGNTCDFVMTEPHTFTNPELARPTLVDGVWKNGTYTYICTCGATKEEDAVRADYSELEEAIEALEGIKNDENLSDEAKTVINNAIAKGEGIAQNLVTAEQDQIDNLVKELQKVKADADEAIKNKELGVEKITEATSGVKVQFIDSDGLGTIENVQLGKDDGFKIRVANGNADSNITITEVKGDGISETADQTIESGKSTDFDVTMPTTAGIKEYTITYTIDGLRDAEGNAVEFTTKAYLYVKGEAYQPYHLMDEKCANGSAHPYWNFYLDSTYYGDFALVHATKAPLDAFGNTNLVQDSTGALDYVKEQYDFENDSCYAGCTDDKWASGDAHAATYRYYIDTSNADTYEKAGLRARLVESTTSDYDNAPFIYVRLANNDKYLEKVVGSDKSFSVTLVPSSTSNVPTKTWTATSNGDMTVSQLKNSNEDEWIFGAHAKDSTSIATSVANFAGAIPQKTEDAKLMFSWRMEFNKGTIIKQAEAVTITTHLYITSYDKAELREAVANAEQAGFNSEYFNSETYKAYEDALKTAKEVLGKAETNQKEVDEATAALNTAIENLNKADAEAKFILTVIHSIHENADKNSEATSTEYDYYLVNGDITPAQIDLTDMQINKKSDIANLTITEDTEYTYYYWYIDYSGAQDAIKKAEEIINNADDYNPDFVTDVTKAKDDLEDSMASDNSPASQDDANTLLDALTGLTGHTCADEDTDHDCDICGATMGTHADVDPKDHKCDYCGGKLTDCTDGNNDHNCDVCGNKLTDCADSDNDHKCDVCGTKLSECADVTTDKDHNCDLCGAENVTEHEYVNPVLTRPAYNKETGEWTNGVYTSTCNCGATETTNIARADYEEYDAVKVALEALLANDKLTQAAKDKITAALEANKIDDNYVATAEEQKLIDDATEALNITLGEINAGISDGSMVYVDLSAYNAALEIYNNTTKNVAKDTDIDTAQTAIGSVAGISATSTKANGNQDKINTATATLTALNEKYAKCAQNEHSYETVTTAPTCTAQGYTTYTCKVCGHAYTSNFVDANGHAWGEWNLTTAPTKDTEGTYTRICSKGDATETKSVAREDYSAYDETVKTAEDLLKDETLTTEAKVIIQNALDKAKELDQNLPADVVVDDEIIIDNDSAEKIKNATDTLEEAIKSLYDENGKLKAEYEKVNFTEYNAAVNAYESLKDNMSEADKNAVAEAMKSVTDAKITENTSKADGQDILDEATAKIVEINAKYGNCAAGNHTWGEPVLTKKPTATEQGEYTETCGICGATQITKVDLANYGDFNTVVSQLQNLAKTENLTEKAANAIADALAKAEALDKNLPADATTADGKVIKGGQDEIDALVAELNKVVTDTNAAITDGSALKPDYANWEIAEGNYDALDKTNVKADIIAEANGLKDTIAGKQADKTLTQATATQDDIDDATARLNQIIAGINDGSLRDPDYSAVENKITEAKGNDNLNKDTQDKIKDIEEELQKIKDKTEPEANAKDDQPAVDALEDQLDEILKDIADNSATAPDYTKWDTAEEAYDDFTAEELQNVKTEILDEVTALKNTINTLKADPTANAKDDQATIDNATTRLNEIITEINGILNEKPDFDGYDNAHDEYENLVVQYGDKIKDSVAEDVADLDEIVDGVRTDETATKIEDQGTVDNAKTQLDAIIDGIKDGSLRDPDYSAVENKINEAKGNDNLNKDTQDKIKDIEEELQKIKDKTEPEANAKDDQPAVDALEDQLDEILKDITDNSAKAPDYTNWDTAEEAYDDFTAEELQNVKTEILDEVTALKNTINTLKADPTANAKDDQKTVNDATARLNQIIEGINNGSLLNPDDGECKHTSTEYVVDNSNGDKLSTHSLKCTACGEILSTEACTFTTKTVEATCHSEGYTLYSCTVCSYGFRADFTKMVPHTYSNWQLVEISCTEVATMTRECIVEGCLAQESKPAEDENGKPVYGMHTLVVVEGKAATCLNDGYTDYTYCIVCNKRTDSTVLPATGHKDDNHNGNCDLCSSPMNPTGHCSCFCHGDSFFEKLLFRIINFFWKLFKINRNCDCGANHW